MLLIKKQYPNTDKFFEVGDLITKKLKYSNRAVISIMVIVILKVSRAKIILLDPNCHPKKNGPNTSGQVTPTLIYRFWKRLRKDKLGIRILGISQLALINIPDHSLIQLLSITIT